MKSRASTRTSQSEAPNCARIFGALQEATRDAMRNGALTFAKADARGDAKNCGSDEKAANPRICADEDSAPVFWVRAAWTACPRDREYSRGGVRKVPTLNVRNLKIEARGADFRSNIAFKLAAAGARATPNGATIGANCKAPRENAARAIARVLASAYRGDGDAKEANGFLNFHLQDDELDAAIARAVEEGESYGAGTSLENTRIAVEFVSADPTGELSFSHAHDAALGDALCRLLELQGASVTREFFINDDPSSSRMKLLGESVAAHYAAILSDASTRGEELREGIIDNAFVREVAREIAEADGDAHMLLSESERASAFSQRLVGRAVASQKEALARLGVRFDEWISEQSLRREGRIAFIVQRLAQRGHIFEKDGATWFRATALGDESDRALQRADGNFTYLATDIAYHAFKIERGFDLLINIWTAAHRPYIERTRIALRAAGYNESRIEMIACEGAKLTRDGAGVERGGEAPTLSDALGETDAQTLRFAMLLRGWDEVAEFDLENARRDDESNAAYAAQLVYSRLGTLLRETQAHASSQESAREYLQAFEGDDAARDVARLVASWPDAAQDAAQSRAPQRIARFVLELAASARVLAATSKSENASTRARLLEAAQITAGAALRVLGLSPREQF